MEDTPKSPAGITAGADLAPVYFLIFVVDPIQKIFEMRN